jgi:hypothetical protein
VRQLEALEAVAILTLLADDVEDRVDEFGALGVMTLGPIVAGARLPEDKIVGTEELPISSGADGIHGAGLQVQKDSPGHVLASVRRRCDCWLFNMPRYFRFDDVSRGWSKEIVLRVAFVRIMG